MNTLRQDKEIAAVTQQREENVARFSRWVVKHPKVRDCEANFRAFQEYMEGEELWGEADLEFAFSCIPERRLVIDRVPTQAEVVERENERRKNLSRAELGELARKEHPAPTAPTLPREIMLPGRKTPTDISTPAALKALAKSNIHAFKWLFNRYGSELMNERLEVQKPQQPGVSVRLPL